MKVLVGSRAMRENGLPVEPNDVDWFTDDTNCRAPGVECFYHPDLERWNWSGSVASLDELYTIKVSHSFWSLHNRSWRKHMTHQMQLKEAGAVFLPGLFEVLYPIWVEKHGPKRVNLEREPEEFFNRGVHRLFDHDSLHQSVRFNDKPLFTKILKDGAPVAVSQSKFDDLLHTEKVKLVFEETFVIALERILLEKNVLVEPGALILPSVVTGERSAYLWALERLMTSLSKGWFPLWISLNFENFARAETDIWSRMIENSDRLIPVEDDTVVVVEEVVRPSFRARLS